MAEKYMFFNSTPDDRRRHQASDMADYWMSFLSTGLIHKDGEPFLKLDVVEGTNKVKVSRGQAILKGHLYMNTTDLELTVPTGSEEKTYLVVLRWDNTIENRYIKLFVKEDEGLTRTESIHELGLYKIKVKPNVTTIDKNDVEDLRLSEYYCGLAYSLVSVPTEYFYEEWDKFVAEYTKWFSDIQNETYATTQDVRVRDYQNKREIAALKFRQDAKDRVENGNTFGNDFSGNNFGAKETKKQTKLTKVAEIGDKVINVSTHSFVVGDSISLQNDDVFEGNRIITSVSNDSLTLNSEVGKKFPVGSSVIQTNTNYKNGITFGEITDGFSFEMVNKDLNGSYDSSFNINSALFATEGATLYKFNTTTGERTRVDAFLGAGEKVVYLRKYVGVTTVLLINYSGKRLEYMLVGEGGLLDKGSHAFNFNLNKITSFSNILNVTSGEVAFGGQYGSNYEILSLTIGTKGVSSAVYSSSTKPTSVRVNQISCYKGVVLLKEGAGSTIRVFDFRGGSPVVSNTGSYSSEFFYSNQLGIRTIRDDGASSVVVREFDSEKKTFSIISKTEVELAERQKYNAIQKNIENISVLKDVLLDGSSSSLKYTNSNLGLSAENKSLVWKEDISINPTTDIYIYSDSGTLNFEGFYIKNKRYANIKRQEGKTIQLTKSYIRFTLDKKTKEVVVFLEYSGNADVNGWLGGVPLQKKKDSKEIQLSGYTSTSESNQLTIELGREKTSDTIVITKMLGGFL